jgi:hypothetical protein
MVEMFVLKEMGIKSTWDFYPGCCYPEIARNMLADTFLKGDYTDAIFIDTDVQWFPGSVSKILSHDRDIVAGIYPYKVDEEGYPVHYELDPDGRPIVDAETGLILGKGLPTGFMRIRRNVFEEMIEKIGDDLIVEDHKDPENVKTYHSFFDTPKIGRTKWGEDLHFCNVWRQLGGEVWIEPDITFWHHGLKAFKGNFHDYLRQLPGGGGAPPEEWKFAPRI